MAGRAHGLLAVVATLAVIACGKDKAAPRPAAAAPTVAPSATGSADPAKAARSAEQWAAAHHEIRCALVTGAATVPYAQHGFADGEAFSRAFAAYAQAEPDAAKAAVAASYAHACAGDARPQPATATPAGAP
jgi:hypothetical protein